MSARDLALIGREREALVEIAKAAMPLSRLPIPLSVDERRDWIIYQNHLHDALARFTEGDRGSGSSQDDGHGSHSDAGPAGSRPDATTTGEDKEMNG